MESAPNTAQLSEKRLKREQMSYPARQKIFLANPKKLLPLPKN